MSHDELTVMTVSALTAQIKYSLGELFSRVAVRGEISDFSRAGSGHLYFNLKDAQSKISAVMWKTSAMRVRFELEEGMEVICHGAVDVYPPRGSYQIVVSRMEPVGIGGLQLAFRQLHKKLAAEGLFDADRKRAIPSLPHSVAVVTSPDGAAIRDFLEVVDRRFPNIEVTVVPVRVQGKGAGNEIASGIRLANRICPRPDVLVVCRGGGSAEDLWAFNEEVVCRAVFESTIPVVSGVGHEIDVTLCDLVADVRALTPSEAAERIVPKKSDLLKVLGVAQSRLLQALKGRFDQATLAARALADRPIFRRPLEWIQVYRQRLDDNHEKMARLVQEAFNRKKRDLEEISAKLQVLSPLNILARGYSMTTNARGEIIRDANSVGIDESIVTRLEKCVIHSQVKSIEPVPLTHDSSHGQT